MAPRLRPSIVLAAALAGLSLGCAAFSPPAGRAPAVEFFAAPRPERDPWFDKVADWQSRERRDRPETRLADAATQRARPQSSLLPIKMGRFEREERLSLLRRITAWSQAAARRHYRFDPPTDAANDPWPTTKDLLDTNGDDCDGLDLIAFELMREFGFPPDELFRAIVKRDRDGANHMVTLWFDEGPDPWVVDATGAVSLRVVRFSQLPGWTPTALFNENDQYTPRIAPELVGARAPGHGSLSEAAP